MAERFDQDIKKCRFYKYKIDFLSIRDCISGPRVVLPTDNGF